MKWLPVILSLFLLPWAWAGELPPPTPRKDRPVADELWMRRVDKEWGNLVVVTSNPNSSRRGKLGDEIFYNNSGSWKHCVNISSTGEGTSWVCAPSAYTAP